MSALWQQRLSQRLTEQRAAGLYRDRPLLTSAPGARVQVNGRWLINFASNDYLGLAADVSLPHEAQALHADAGMAGSTASHVLAGHHLPHHLLEDELADWLGVERTLLFSSGYLANLAVQSALLSSGDQLIHDKLNHASLIDGALLSGVPLKRYPHGDMSALARRLADVGDDLAMVVTDGVFSMNGDLAPLAQMMPLLDADRHLLVVDEAHAFGVLGVQGRGSFDALGLAAGASVLRVGTLGKAFASSGAFIAGSGVMIDAIAQFARSYRYTTAQPPYQASFSRAALRRVMAGDDLRQRLQQLIAYFRQGAQQLGLTLVDSITPIQPIMLGASSRAMQWQQWLWDAGFWVPGIRPPTVPQGQARLRLSLAAYHTTDQLDALLAALAACQQREAAHVSL